MNNYELYLTIFHRLIPCSISKESKGSNIPTHHPVSKNKRNYTRVRTRLFAIPTRVVNFTLFLQQK